MTDTYKIKCIPLKQPIGQFYVGVIPSDELIKLSYSDIRRMSDNIIDDEYIGIQRPLDESRVSEIKRYVRSVDATFPTAVTLHISSKYIIKYDNEKFELEVIKKDNIFKIIDGQHRIKGLEGYNEKDFDINVVIFIDLDIEDQAMIFSTINLKQTKVNKSIVYDLFEFTKRRSPQKTCHNISKMLNKSEGPFKNRIKILGKAIYGGEFITQARFVEDLVPYITENTVVDRNIIKTSASYEIAKQKLGQVKCKKSELLIFREHFINDEDDKIYLIINNYFSAINQIYETAWNNSNNEYILSKSIGFSALMKLLGKIHIAFGLKNQDVSTGTYKKILQKSKLENKDFITSNFSLGKKGEREILNMIFDKILNESK